MSESIYYLLCVLLCPLSTLWRGYVLSVIWRWFMVSAFDLPALGVVQSMGVMSVVGFMVYQFRADKIKDERPPAERLIEVLCVVVLGPLFTLGVCYLIKLFL